METLEQLVKERRGYKYLSSEGISPYKKYKYDLSSKKQIKFPLDTDTKKNCGEGCNLATLKWIADNCMKLDGIIVECSIPPKATIVVPVHTDGKFRTDIIKFEKIYKIEDKFLSLKDFKRRLEDYTPINPITAETMPDVSMIKKILSQVRDQVMDQVWDQVMDQVMDKVWDKVRAQVMDQVCDQVMDKVWDKVRAQVMDQVWDQVMDKVWDQVWAQVMDKVWDQVMDKVMDQVRDQVGDQVRAQVMDKVRDKVRDKVGDQVWAQVMDKVWDQVMDKVMDQVRDQVRLCGYYALKLFMNLDYEHPVFDLIRLGVLVVKAGHKYKVFGKNGMFLGEFN